MIKCKSYFKSIPRHTVGLVEIKMLLFYMAISFVKTTNAFEWAEHIWAPVSGLLEDPAALPLYCLHVQ